MKEFFDTNLGDSHKGEVEMIVDMIKNGSILDVGCGQGNLEILLEKIGYKKMTCLDSSKISLEKLRSRTKDTRTVWHDLNYLLPFADDEFDTVICCEVLEHVENPMQVMKECMRVGKETIIAVPNGFWIELIPKNWTMVIPNYYAPTKKLLTSAIHWLGGEVTEWRYYYSDFKFIRKFFPRWFSTSFIVRARKR